MAVTFTNNWKNILDKLESILEAEFKGALPVYKGNSVPKGVNQALQLIPSGSVLSDYNATSETREFTVNVRFIFAEANIRETALDHVLRYVSRIEALIHDNVSMSYTNENSQTENVFNCRFESTELNSDEDSGLYVTQWEWKCQHLGNVS
tara:strand:- start:500 stop:949 length:450 start_codon:yes stop_codon:yes gene_type:complete